MINSETTACDEFDMVIIGAGPSAIGLLYGLLRPYSTGPKAAATGDHDDQHHTSSAPPPFKIAIIERGPLFCSNDKSSPSSSPTNKNPLLQVQQDPKLWFCAAHPSSSNPLENILYKRDEKKEPYSSIVYRTVPQTRGLGNRVLSVPTGQGLGGGTNINACLFVRPTKDDFEHWPNYWKESVLGEDHVMRPRIMQSVVQIERIMRNNGALVDQQEEAEIMIHRNDDDDHSDVIMSEREIIKEEAIKDNKNNASTSTGLYLDYEKIMLTQPKKKNDKIWKRRWKLGKVTSTIRQKDVNSSEGSLGTKGNTYERVNYYQGILKPLLEENPNMGKSLQFFTGVLAERLLMHRENDSNVVTAKGVECSHVGAKGEKVLFTIRGKIVVVCAGAILTPALLLASGIGEERELRNQGVTPILEGEDNVWKGVGKRLCDHVIVATGFWTNRRFTSVDVPNSVRGWLAMDITDDRNRYNLSSSKHKARLLLKVMDGSSSSCILPGVIASTFHRVYFFEPHFVCRQTLQILVCLMNPKSMGAVSIQHRGKGENCRGLSNFDVQIDPAYLSREEDFVGISLGAHIVKKLSSCWIPNSIELLPGYLYKGIGGSDYLRKYVSDFALPYYHWSGTCSIKSDLVSEGSHVVDEQLRVRQVTNLYICDASVHPKIISAPPALTLAAMGLTVSSILHDLIRPKTE